MKKQNIFFTLIVLCVFCACGGRTATNTGTAGEQPSPAVQVRSGSQVLALSDSLIRTKRADTVDMGRIRTGEVVSRTLTLRNAGDTPLVIIDVDKSCGCVDIDYPRQPLRAGEEAPVELSFDSRGITGWVYKTVYFKTSSPSGNYTLVVTADVE